MVDTITELRMEILKKAYKQHVCCCDFEAMRNSLTEIIQNCRRYNLR
jgi:hypothetical protein